LLLLLLLYDDQLSFMATMLAMMASMTQMMMVVMVLTAMMVMLDQHQRNLVHPYHGTVLNLFPVAHDLCS
jgi:hypothetical protein